MDVPADLQTLAAIGAAIAAIVVGAIGYILKRPADRGATAAIRGAAIVDSSAVLAVSEALGVLVEAQNRTAIALEEIAKIMRERDERAEREQIEELRREVADLRKGGRSRST